MLETSTEGVLECPDCGGEGVLLEQGAPGLFWDREQSFFPSERLVPCPRCSGVPGSRSAPARTSPGPPPLDSGEFRLAAGSPHRRTDGCEHLEP